MKTLVTCFFLSTFYFLLPTSAFAQGVLTPPGAPAPTMKTLDQIEARSPLGQPISPATLPILISAAGSYYLTGNVTAPGGYSGHGITVNASNVTIDLNGFALTGVTGSGAGVIIGGVQSNVTVRNGTIRLWGADGINGVGNRNTRVENVRAISNGSIGIAVDANGVVSHCVADSSSGRGILGTTNCLIKECQTNATSGSPGNGFDVSTGSVMTECASTGDGIGFQMTTDCQLSNCKVINPTSGDCFAFGNRCSFNHCSAVTGMLADAFGGYNQVGPLFSSNCVFRGCSGSSSAGSAIFRAGAGSTFENCTASGPGAGFVVFGNSNDADGTGASFSNCTATGNGSGKGFDVGKGCSFANCSANLYGSVNFNASNSCTFIGCTALGNSSEIGAGVGFFVGNQCTLVNCTASGGIGDGFRYGNACLLIGNNATNNGVVGTTVGNGFHSNGNGFGRLDGNTATFNSGTGFLPNAQDQVIRNTSIGNTVANYNPASGTNIGPVGAPNTATSPWANF